MSPNQSPTSSLNSPSTMSNVNYSLYNDFVTLMEDLLPWLPKILQNCFNRMMVNEVYGTPNAQKEGELLDFAVTGDRKQVISPLSIMIECVSELYHGMHDLGLFASQVELGRQMQIKINLFIANKEWNADHILDLKIEGPMDPTCDTEQYHHPIKDEAPM